MYFEYICSTFAPCLLDSLHVAFIKIHASFGVGIELQACAIAYLRKLVSNFQVKHPDNRLIKRESKPCLISFRHLKAYFF